MLAANGARVVIAEVDKAKTDETVAQINDAYGADTASASVADLVAPGACDQLVADVMNRFGALSTKVGGIERSDQRGVAGQQPRPALPVRRIEGY